MTPNIFQKLMAETEEQRLTRQTKQAEELKQKQVHDEQLRFHKLAGDKKMVQHYSSSTTDKHGHHIKRWWAVVSLEPKGAK